MKKILLFVDGVINPSDSSRDTGEYGTTPASLRNQFAKQLRAVPDFEEVEVRISSPGGSVVAGLEIYEWLRGSDMQGRPVTTVVLGECASIATVILLAGDKRKTSKYQKLGIHQAWAETSGTASQLRANAEELESANAIIAGIYQERANYREALTEEMKFLSAEQALKMGFVTEIISAKQMTYKKISNLALMAQNKKGGGFLNFLKKHLAGIKNFDTTLSDGTAIFIDGEDAVVGAPVFLADSGEAAPDGQHTLEDGRVISVADGVIVEVAAAPAAAQDIEALKAQWLAEYKEKEEQAKAQAAEKTEEEKMQAMLAEAKAQLQNTQAEVAKLQKAQALLQTGLQVVASGNDAGSVKDKPKGIQADFGKWKRAEQFAMAAKQKKGGIK